MTEEDPKADIPNVDEVNVEDLSDELGAGNCLGTLGSGTCPACLGTAGSFT